MSAARVLPLLLSTVLLMATPPAVLAKDADAKGCADHPLLTRMAGMHIVTCRSVDFDKVVFRTGKGQQTPVEGKRFEARYQADKGQTVPSPLAILRNHQQAIAKIGGTTAYEDARYTTLTVTQAGTTIWAQVDTAWGGGYVLTIVEVQSMRQEVVASAAAFRAGLAAQGHVEVPGIFFDTGKAVLTPASDAAVAEVATLLKADPSLKVYVVGHTDNTAALELNTRLSQARAEAVVGALVGTHGISAARLVARGIGPLAPVASNDDDSGRAKNRRVELVKQ